MATLEIFTLLVPVLVRATRFTSSDPSCTWPKSTIVGEISKVDVEEAFTVCETPAEVLLLKFASPE